ncbi:MAG TPA: glycosyltransferase family 4 protein, partial [Longimicrobium sp.]|nr:glycosyltransferase family 4 protein [Longimicrobium sp.]
LRDDHGVESHFLIDDRSGITRRVKLDGQVRITYTADPSRGPAALLRYWRDFVRCFEADRPDVLEVYTAIHPVVILPMVAYARARRVPCVVVCRGELYPEAFLRQSALRRGAFARILRLADLIVYKEPYMAAMLREMSPGTAAYPWSNAVPVAPEPDYARTENHVLFLNFFKRPRNLDVIVRAAARVRERVPDVQVHLVGGTRQLADRSEFYRELHEHELELEALIRSLGVEGCVHIHPFTTVVEPYFSAAKVFVFPSDNVFCNYSLLEAMERGVPPVVSDDRDPNARLIVEDGESGRVAPIDPAALADAVVELLSDEEERRRLGRGARRKVEREYNLSLQIAALAEQYRAVARRAGREV